VTPLEVLRRYPAHDYSLYGALASRAQRIPQHSFIEFENERISYAEARARVHQAMALLA
jgi:carnitine-CoA ligase